MAWELIGTAGTLSGADGADRGLHWNETAGQLYIANYGSSWPAGAVVVEYDLDPASPSLVATGDSFVYGNQGTSSNAPTDVFFRPDGSTAYVARNTSTGAPHLIHQYTLTTPWDLSTATYASKSHAVSDVPRGIHLRPDGLRLFTFNETTITAHDLATAWDISTASLAAASYDYGSDIFGGSFPSDGASVYIVDFLGKQLVEKELASTWDLSTVGSTIQTIDLSGTPGYPVAAELSIDESKVIVLTSDGVVGVLSSGTVGPTLGPTVGYIGPGSFMG